MIIRSSLCSFKKNVSGLICILVGCLLVGMNHFNCSGIPYLIFCRPDLAQTSSDQTALSRRHYPHHLCSVKCSCIIYQNLGKTILVQQQMNIIYFLINKHFINSFLFEIREWRTFVIVRWPLSENYLSFLSLVKFLLLPKNLHNPFFIPVHAIRPF